MSERERWIVYPLLLFSLALGLRDKLVPTRDAEFAEITCHELRVVAPLTKARRAYIGGNSSDAGMMLVYGSTGKPALSLGADAENFGRLALMDAQGITSVEAMGATATAGIRIQPDAAGPTLLLGRDHTTSAVGLMALDDHDRLLSADPEDASSSVPWGTALPDRQIPADDK